MGLKNVWHTRLKSGKIIHADNDTLKINFEDSGVTSIKQDVWGTHLFLSAEDYQMMLEGGSIGLTQKYRFLRFPVCKKAEFRYFEGKSTRDIQILSNRMFPVMKMMQIIGLDIETGKIVDIVDTNGASLGYHSLEKCFTDLPEGHIIRADFKCYPYGAHFNTLRIVSSFEDLGPGEVANAKLLSFTDVQSICSILSKKHYHFLVNFTGTEIRPYRDKFQLKMDSYFVDIRDNNFQFASETPYYIGPVLLRCDIRDDGHTRFAAQRLLGRYHSREEYQEIVASRPIFQLPRMDKPEFYDEEILREYYEDDGTGKLSLEDRLRYENETNEEGYIECSSDDYGDDGFDQDVIFALSSDDEYLSDCEAYDEQS